MQTKYSDDFVVLNDLQGAGNDKAEHVETFALVKDHVTWSAVYPVEMNGQST